MLKREAQSTKEIARKANNEAVIPILQNLSERAFCLGEYYGDMKPEEKLERMREKLTHIFVEALQHEQAIKDFVLVFKSGKHANLVLEDAARAVRSITFLESQPEFAQRVKTNDGQTTAYDKVSAREGLGIIEILSIQFRSEAKKLNEYFALLRTLQQRIPTASYEQQLDIASAVTALHWLNVAGKPRRSGHFSKIDRNRLHVHR